MPPERAVGKKVLYLACYHPLKGFIVGKTARGKDKLKVTSYEVDHLERPDESRSYIPVFEKDTVWSDVLYPSYDIPCGHCIGCRLDRSREWANRCLLEMKKYESNLFITLTYDDDHVPTSTGRDPDSGELFTTYTLRKEDWQLFMKRLRRWYDTFYNDDRKIRFFACGEYGSTTYRPHYHAILFNCSLPDMKWYKRTGDYDYFTSEILSQLWSDSDEYQVVNGKKIYVSRGFAVVAPASWETAAYTARYVTKKLYGEATVFYDNLGIEPEFALMSRRPGIAGDYFEENKDHILDFKKISVSTPEGGKTFPSPKYFKRKFDLIFENDLGKMVDRDEQTSLEHSLMESVKLAQESQTSLSYLDMLSSAEHVKQDQVKGLGRSLL